VVGLKLWILAFRLNICMINIFCIFYVFRSLNVYFWLGNDGDMISLMFSCVLLSKSKLAKF
jgi:hypothetical protein